MMRLLQRLISMTHLAPEGRLSADGIHMEAGPIL